MGSADTLYAAEFELPDLIEQGRDNLLKCPVLRRRELAVPSSGTVTVQTRAGVKLVDGAAVTIPTGGPTPGVAQFLLVAATVAAESRDEGWMVLWSLTMPDGVVHTFRNDGALVLARLYPVVTDRLLEKRISALGPEIGRAISKKDSHQDSIDMAWVDIQNRLIQRGNRPNLVMSPTSLRKVHMELTFAYIFEDLATRLNAAYLEQSDMHRRAYEREWASLNFLYDSGDTGVAELSDRRRPAATSIWTTARW